MLTSFAAAAQAPLDVRVALVIGNSAYPGEAALETPANDAAAMKRTLAQLGFAVVDLEDGSREQMTAAIASVRDRLRGKQAIGMLYYAGHGLQLDWHNYMVPVDAKMNTAADVPAQTVDIDSVITAFKAAGNRMNIVVLDACRDNPFSSNASGKGLAQLDAPPGTFLAYATAPGNVAEDGTEGTNGLYTGYLVQELAKPAVKIEDVFKRVRLQVRQKSQGRQVPWESTSLEEDFFFNDGQKFMMSSEELANLAAQAKQREQVLLQQAAQAREKEWLLAQELKQQRERHAMALRDAQAQELAMQARVREADRLTAQARTSEQARLAAESKLREEQRLVAEASARERERELALAQQQERDRAAAAVRALEVARQAEQVRIKELEQAKAEAFARANEKSDSQSAAEAAFAREKSDWDRIAESRNPEDY
jgi:uncharacterized caspase-like protein